jgi:uncharacterized protein YqhQ
MKKNSCPGSCSDRLNKVGGQAVLEGVMMKAGPKTVTTCRKDDGSIVVYDNEFISVRKKHKILNLPIIRGVVNFVEMLILSMNTLNASADALGIQQEEDKFEKWCKKHLGAKSTDVIMGISLVLGVALSLLLFMFLPTWSADGINWLWQNLFRQSAISPTVIAILEGVLKVTIFIVYLLLVSMMKDIKRTFMYHGAEHKTIACFEAGDELTPENAMKHKRFHPRCGTSFMFFMILIGIIIGFIVRSLIPEKSVFVYTGIGLLTLPLLMGIGFEFIMFAGKHDNFVTRMLSAPGLWVQRLTTKEPTEDMLEIAIISTKCALRDEIAEFEEFFNARPWEKKPNDEEAEAQSSDGESKTDPEENLESVSAFETELVAEEKNENLPEGEEA